MLVTYKTLQVVFVPTFKILIVFSSVFQLCNFSNLCHKLTTMTLFVRLLHPCFVIDNPVSGILN